MSRFDDFNDFLSSITPSQNAEEFLAQTEHAVKKSFEVFGDFYKNVLEPRGNFRLVAKQEDHSNRYKIQQVTNPLPIYNYVVFVIPKDDSDWPMKKDHSSVITDQFDLTDKITDLDWSPNVVMQFSVEIFPVWDSFNHNHKPIFHPRVEIKSWGETVYKQIQNMIAKPHVGSYGKAWDKIYTIMRLFPGSNFSSQDESELINALKLSGINAINHRNFWFGPRLLAEPEVKKLN